MARKAKKRQRSPQTPQLVLQPIPTQPSLRQQHGQLSSRRAKKRDRFGFKDKTLWDLLSVFLIPLMIGIGTIGVTWQQNFLSERQHESDQLIAKENRQKDLQIADEQQKEEILVNYQKEISDLLLNYKLGSSAKGDPVREVARAKTLAALRRLDANREGILLQFLHESQLIRVDQPVVSLADADLHGMVLKSKVQVLDVSTTEQTSDKNASSSTYTISTFGWMSLEEKAPDLSNADLSGTDLSNADLSGINLSRTDLSNVYLYHANLGDANLQGANLTSANLFQANLTGADLHNANLKDTNLNDANLSATSFAGTNIKPEQLAKASSLEDTILPNGSTFPSASWPVPGRDEKCVDLVGGKCYDQDGKETESAP